MRKVYSSLVYALLVLVSATSSATAQISRDFKDNARVLTEKLDVRAQVRNRLEGEVDEQTNLKVAELRAKLDERIAWRAAMLDMGISPDSLSIQAIVDEIEAINAELESLFPEPVVNKATLFAGLVAALAGAGVIALELDEGVADVLTTRFETVNKVLKYSSPTVVAAATFILVEFLLRRRDSLILPKVYNSAKWLVARMNELGVYTFGNKGVLAKIEKNVEEALAPVINFLESEKSENTKQLMLLGVGAAALSTGFIAYRASK